MTTEADVIRLAQAGDEDAFSELYQRNLDVISSYIRRRVDDVDEAENLTQVVFVKAWQALERYQPTKVPFRAWLYRIAGNTVIDYYRTHKETTDIDSQWHLADEQASPEEILLSGERSESVRSAITQLRPSYQQVISLRFMDERDYPETALALDRQVNAVRVLQHRALGALQKVLTSEQISWVVTMVAVLTLALGGSIALAAEGSVPGDILYPVKRTLESSLLLAADDALDVRLHTRFANRRIGEMSRLVDSDNLIDLAIASNEYIEQISSLTISLSQLMEAKPKLATEYLDDAVRALETQAELLSELSPEGAVAVTSALQKSIAAARQAQADVERLAPATRPPASFPAPTSLPQTATPAPAKNSDQVGSLAPQQAGAASGIAVPLVNSYGITTEPGLGAQPGMPKIEALEKQNSPGASPPSDTRPSVRQPQNEATKERQRGEVEIQTTDLLPPAASIVQTMLTNLELVPRPEAPMSPPRIAPLWEAMDEAQMLPDNKMSAPSDEPHGQSTKSTAEQAARSKEANSADGSGDVHPIPSTPPHEPQTESNASSNESPSKQSTNNDQQGSVGQQDSNPQGSAHDSPDPSADQRERASLEPSATQSEPAPPGTAQSSNSSHHASGDDETNADQDSPDSSQDSGTPSSQRKDQERQ